MYIPARESFGQAEVAPIFCPPLQIPQDVIDARIDVFAQRALLRMLKGDADAMAMLCAVNTNQLAGIYKEDQRVPALRARKMSLGWWNLISKGENAAVIFDSLNSANAPIIVFRDRVRSHPGQLDSALRKAWTVSQSMRTEVSNQCLIGESPDLAVETLSQQCNSTTHCRIMSLQYLYNGDKLDRAVCELRSKVANERLVCHGQHYWYRLALETLNRDGISKPTELCLVRPRVKLKPEAPNHSRQMLIESAYEDVFQQ